MGVICFLITLDIIMKAGHELEEFARHRSQVPFMIATVILLQ